MSVKLGLIGASMCGLRQLESPSFFLAGCCSPVIGSIIRFLALSNATFLLVYKIELLGARVWIMLGSTGCYGWRPLHFP